ncbi:1,4-dihydroxy-2-naphthoate octaprenyltransferase [Carnobacterium gallinarum]|uniref:1,4-dihydroxy-2-naphthoate octaprenyltransferase n=1 Tax=Carnobacterium gallinarum TaxID=2749 RepID=UPI00054FC70D|nr:1,4-dihydroxy-2-naphthoate octaprenyltransferase [Carnobacterium gallinarum]
MIQKIKQNVLYHPLFLIFIHPLSFILFGTVFALQFAKFNWIYFTLFYVFILSTQFIENILNNTIKTQQKLKLMPLIIFEGLVILLLFYFSLHLNYLVGLLMFGYLFIIHFQFYPYDLSKTLYGFILNGLFKGGILTYLAFFIQTQFITTTLYYWSVPLIILASFISFGRQCVPILEQPAQRKRNQLYFLLMLTLLYLSMFIPVISLSSGTKYLWLQLLSLPFALRLMLIMKPNQDNYTSTTKLKALTLFNFSYILLASMSILLQILWK